MAWLKSVLFPVSFIKLLRIVNGWVFVHELSGFGFEYRCSHFKEQCDSMISLLKFFRIFQKHLFPGGSIECQLMTYRGRGDDTNFEWLWIRGTGVRFFTKFFWSGYSWDNVKKLRNSHRRCSLRKGALRNFTKFTGKHLACNFIKKETLAQEFSCEFCEISRNTIFAEHLATASRNFLIEIC